MPRSTDDEQRFRAVHRRLARTGQLGALAIILAITVSTLNRWDHLAIILGFHLTLFTINVVLFDRLVDLLGARTELLRAFFNSTVGSIGYELVGWPLPAWFWLVYSAVSVDTFGGRGPSLALVITCGVQSAFALAFGVPPIYPAAFTLLAFVIRYISSAKVDIIREMLAESQEQHRELAHTHQQLKAEAEARERAVSELRQAQKLEAIGRLASGVAHEINTPMQFIGDNLRFVTDGVSDLLALATRAPHDEADAADLPYLQANLPTALANAADGVTRVATIVRSMKQFAHAGDVALSHVDLNETVRSTLTIAAHEYRLVADLTVDLADLPRVECNGSEISQVLLNLVVNAAHAIADRVGTEPDGSRGRITIRSRVVDDCVVLSVADTGGGIRPSIQHRVFEPFFTTKDLGRGTGQGLSISSAAVNRHGGSLSFETTAGYGTTFYIKLPLTAARREAA